MANNTLTRQFQKIKSLPYDNHRWAVIASAVLLIPFLIFLMATGALFVGDWYFALFLGVPGFIAGVMSGSSYLGRLRDVWSFRKVGKKTTYVSTPFNAELLTIRHYGKSEKWGTTLGLIAGIIFTIVLIALHRFLPFASGFSWFAYTFLGVANISACAGLGNRVGVCLDKDKKSRLATERVGMIIGGTVALTCSLVILFVAQISGFNALLGLGALTFFTAGPALPLVLAGILFVAMSTSAAISAADYLMRMVNFIHYWRIKESELSKPEEQRSRYFTKVESGYNEYKGATIGCVIGIVLGVTVAALMPYLVGGVLAAVAAAFVITVAINIFAGMGARIGRVIDAHQQMQAALREQRRAPAAEESEESEEAGEEDSLLADHSRELSEDATHDAEPSPKAGKSGTYSIFAKMKLLISSCCGGNDESLQQGQHSSLFAKTSQQPAAVALTDGHGAAAVPVDFSMTSGNGAATGQQFGMS